MIVLSRTKPGTSTSPGRSLLMTSYALLSTGALWTSTSNNSHDEVKINYLFLDTYVGSLHLTSIISVRSVDLLAPAHGGRGPISESWVAILSDAIDFAQLSIPLCTDRTKAISQARMDSRKETKKLTLITRKWQKNPSFGVYLSVRVDFYLLCVCVCVCVSVCVCVCVYVYVSAYIRISSSYVFDWRARNWP